MVEQRVFTVPEIELMAKFTNLDIVHFHGSLDMEVDNLFHEDAHEMVIIMRKPFTMMALCLSFEHYKLVDIGSHIVTRVDRLPLRQQCIRGAKNSYNPEFIKFSLPSCQNMAEEQGKHTKLICIQISRSTSWQALPDASCQSSQWGCGTGDTTAQPALTGFLQPSGRAFAALL